MKAAVTLFIFFVFLALNQAAPQAKVRVKRALEQLEYGNHQNRPRVKKADPNVPQKLMPPNPIATKRLEETKSPAPVTKVESDKAAKSDVAIVPKEKTVEEDKELSDIYDWLMKSMKPEMRTNWRKKRSSATAEDMSGAPVQARSKRSLYYDLPMDVYEDEIPFDDDETYPSLYDWKDPYEYYENSEYPTSDSLIPEDEEDISELYGYKSEPTWKRAAPYGLYDTVSEKRSREEAMNRLYALAYRLGKKK
ncbi:unnamed protein product [Dimorphilus gyrociliatus]|uniref:Uncharacterized protein n=1 Tax=Dimorphilus gyrociliatus TaxID=2664684 RepID=A0A7I8VM59_9ANNE|nr:unnamed protein product [Dimorphilus gyrociliatus]